MNWNDLELTDQLRVIFNNFAVLNMHVNNCETGYTFDCLANIEDAARKAQWRIRNMKEGFK
jgi:hypothetical protein